MSDWQSACGVRLPGEFSEHIWKFIQTSWGPTLDGVRGYMVCVRCGAQRTS